MCGPCLIADRYPSDPFSPHVIARPDVSERGNLIAINLPLNVRGTKGVINRGEVQGLAES